MEIIKQGQKAGDNSTQIQAGVFNNNVTLITNGVGFPDLVGVGNRHSATEKVKKDYFVQKCKFSFARSATSFICAELMRDDVLALLEMMLCLQHK